MKMKYSQTDLNRLSSKQGLSTLLSEDPPNIAGSLARLKYEESLQKLQVQLIHLQNWVLENDERILILFEGGEFAGKGSTIKAFMEHLNPRSNRLVALPKPSLLEEGQWYFQRYIIQLPKPGEIVLFDRSWYNRAVVEPVNGFCTKKQYQQFMNEVNYFEKMLYNDGIIIIKIYLEISKEEQAKRIEMVRENPLRRWELTPVDENAQALWNKYQSYTQKMFAKTHSRNLPWKLINSDDKYSARLIAIKHVLSRVPYRKPQQDKEVINKG
jgi:polyphosphate kinase 2